MILILPELTSTGCVILGVLMLKLLKVKAPEERKPHCNLLINGRHFSLDGQLSFEGASHLKAVLVYGDYL
jgi:hypothetical protein